jgi:hypothetical protein
MPLDLIGFDRADLIGDDDDIGDDFAVGADDLDTLLALTGAVSQRPELRGRPNLAQAARRLQAMKQQALAAQVHPRVAAVTARSATRRREFPLGFDSGLVLIPAGGVASIPASPQVIFRGERLVVPSNIAASFFIVNIVVGKDSQQVAPAPIPAVAFSEVGVGVRLMLDTAQPGVLITLQVQNISLVPARFYAALIGTVAE